MSQRHSGSGNVRPFRRGVELDAEQNLQEYIERARLANPLRVHEWDAAYWPFPKMSRASAASDGGLRFTERSANTRDPGVLPEPFISFIKAVVCHHNMRKAVPYAAGQSQTLVAAARLLHSQIAWRGSDPSKLTAGDFNTAAKRAQEMMGDGAANVGSKLAIIVDEINRNHLTATRIDWRNPIKRGHKHDRVGMEAAKRRHEKLPSREVLEALGEISARTDLDDRDLIVQRVIDLLAGGGFRINEVLTLPRDTLIEEAVLDEDGRPALDQMGRPAFRIGLRYWPEKGGHKVAQIKWVPTVMGDLVKRAVTDVLRITEPFAGVAKHQRKVTNSTLLGTRWDHLPGDHLFSTCDVAQILGFKPGGTRHELSGAGSQFLRIHDVPSVMMKPAEVEATSSAVGHGRGKRQTYVTKDALCEALYRRSQHGNVLNGSVGYLDIADALFVVPDLYVKRSLNCGTNGTVRLLADNIVQVYLSSQANGIQPSIFERLGYRNEDGEPLSLNSHQFRHLLTTLAAEGSMSEMEIARWMGRADLSQNAAYTHVSPVVRAQRLRDKILIEGALGPVGDIASRMKDPVRREEFITSNTQAAHITDLGVCVHPWDAAPCAEHGECGGCSELRLVKGEERSRRNALANLELVRKQIEAAKAADDDGDYGADNWLEAQRSAESAMLRILAVHDDASIEEGAIVQLPKVRRAERIARSLV